MTQEVHPLVNVAEHSDPTVAASAAPGSAQSTVPAAHSPSAPRWLGFLRLPRTLTARLAAGVVVLVILIVVAVGTVTYYQLHSFLFSRLDQQVSAQAAQVAASLSQPRQVSQCNPAYETCQLGVNRAFGPPLSQQAQWIVLLGPDGDERSTVVSGGDLRQLDLPADVRAELAESPSGVHTVTTTDGHDIRVAVVEQSGYVVVSGISTSEVEATLHRLLLLEIAIGGTGILLALILTTAGMWFGLRPLKRVTRTAQEVTAELSPEGAGLDRRVPETDSTTEVGQLATSFNTMLNTVETEFRARRESEERMRQFLADASHELRTPLTSIRGYAELARLQNARNGIAPAEDDSLGRIETEGTRMSRLVEDLLTLARGDAADDDSPIERGWIDVAELVDEVVAGVHVANPDRAIESRVDDGLSLWGDHNQIVRMLRNLATNAAVHTDPVGAIKIEGHREGANVVLQVIDEGPGLPPSEAEHVFERFWRADKARTRVRGGSGLGMSIVAQIVHAHGGQVYFDSSVEGGSTVTAVIPGGTR